MFGLKGMYLHLQCADKPLINQLVLVLLERSDQLYELPAFKADVHRWVPALPCEGLAGIESTKRPASVLGWSCWEWHLGLEHHMSSTWSCPGAAKGPLSSGNAESLCRSIGTGW